MCLILNYTLVGNSEVVETLPKLVPMDKISLLVPVYTTPI